MNNISVYKDIHHFMFFYLVKQIALLTTLSLYFL